MNIGVLIYLAGIAIALVAGFLTIMKYLTMRLGIILSIVGFALFGIGIATRSTISAVSPSPTDGPGFAAKS